MELPNLRRETIYGMPAADQILFNRHYVLGYSYYFRQAKWALEIVSAEQTINVNDMKPGVKRLDNFRSDYRIPEMFRADRVDYEGSGHHRGHLVASANKRDTELQNSETFLLSNMSPQKPGLNTGIWKDLESAIRKLDKKSKILETFVICGPIYYFDQPVKSIGADDSNDVSIPIPNAYFKSVLAENRRGNFHMWSFVMPNEKSTKSFDSFLEPTTLVEKLAGIKLWERLTGSKMDKEKSKVRKIW